MRCFNSAVHVCSPTQHSVKRSVTCEQNSLFLQIRNQIQPPRNDRDFSTSLMRKTRREFFGLCRHGCTRVCVVHAYIKLWALFQVGVCILHKTLKIPDTEQCMGLYLICKETNLYYQLHNNLYGWLYWKILRHRACDKHFLLYFFLLITVN